MEIIERKLALSNSSKMKPPLNAPKARETVPAGFLKKQELSKKYLKNKWKSIDKNLRAFAKTK